LQEPGAAYQEFVETVAEYKFTLRIHESRWNFAKWLTPGRYQVIEPPDEKGWLTVQFAMESKDLAQMLVFGLGAQAIVIEPDELGETVLNKARELLKHHSDGNPQFRKY
jgi:predicted DNA-binding transcriptional regulator YafY